MNTNDQTPECCPFCGTGIYKREAAIGASGEYVRKTEYKCGSGRVFHQNEVTAFRSSDCAYVIEQRLTRERDEARVLAARRGEVLEKLVSKASASLASAGIQEGELSDRIEWACARVKRLEEALEACAAIIGPRDKVTWATDEQVDHAWELYTKAKEATP